MCNHSSVQPAPEPQELVHVDVSDNKSNGIRANGVHRINGANGNVTRGRDQQRRNPYASRASDFLSNISNFSVIESTLRGSFTVLLQLLINQLDMVYLIFHPMLYFRVSGSM
jgi:homocitrate synthase